MLSKCFNYRLAVWLLAALFITACANGGLKEKPTAMPDDLPNMKDLSVDWMHVLGDASAAKPRGQINPLIIDDLAYLGLATGEVFSVNLTGQLTELAQFENGLATTVAGDSTQFAVALGNGDISLTDSQFNTIWTLPLNSLAGNQPLLTNERVFVQTIDGRINAIERITGRLLWTYQDAQPNLTLTGTSKPVLIETASGAAVVTGLANGKLLALSVTDGSVIWEYRIAKASGKTDVSRLVDVDAQVAVIGNRLIATGFQGDLVVVKTANGQVVQALKLSSYRSIVADEDQWFAVTADSHVIALDATTLEQKWSTEAFEYRQLSELAIIDGKLFVGDKQGYLHVLDTKDGQWLSSRHIDWRGSNTDPVVFGDGVLFQGYSTRIKHLKYQAN